MKSLRDVRRLKGQKMTKVGESKYLVLAETLVHKEGTKFYEIVVVSAGASHLLIKRWGSIANISNGGGQVKTEFINLPTSQISILGEAIRVKEKRGYRPRDEKLSWSVLDVVGREQRLSEEELEVIVINNYSKSSTKILSDLRRLKDNGAALADDEASYFLDAIAGKVAHKAHKNSEVVVIDRSPDWASW